MYPTDIEITYNTTREYRECIRRLFKMNTQPPNETLNEDEPLDEETLDELNYDHDSANMAMDNIRDRTIDHDLFRELYTVAAARMMSTDLETGMAVLLSYDYLLWFHQCLVCFFTSPNEFTRSSKCYMELHRRVA